MCVFMHTGIEAGDWKNIGIAYEPVWAIGEYPCVYMCLYISMRESVPKSVCVYVHMCMFIDVETYMCVCVLSGRTI